MIRTAIDVDREAAPTMLWTVRTYLETFDCHDEDFDSVAEYMPYRISNCGYWMSFFFIRWGMATDLTGEKYESIREYDHAMGNILGLTNDHFSWNVERDQPRNRVRNGVKVLMQEHKVIEGLARRMLLAMIIEEETRAVRLRQEKLEDYASEAVLQYIEAIELYVGGSCYWHSSAPRYQKFE